LVAAAALSSPPWDEVSVGVERHLTTELRPSAVHLCERRGGGGGPRSHTRLVAWPSALRGEQTLVLGVGHFERDGRVLVVERGDVKHLAHEGPAAVRDSVASTERRNPARQSGDGGGVHDVRIIAARADNRESDGGGCGIPYAAVMESTGHQEDALLDRFRDEILGVERRLCESFERDAGVRWLYSEVAARIEDRSTALSVIAPRDLQPA
jgi:hypothetical protein